MRDASMRYKVYQADEELNQVNEYCSLTPSNHFPAISWREQVSF